MQKWEYKVISRGFDTERMANIWFDTGEVSTHDDGLSKRLNQEGENGWELVSVERLEDTDFHLGVRTYYLKRAV